MNRSITVFLAPVFRVVCCALAVSPLAFGAGGIRTDGTVGANANWLGKPQSLAGNEVAVTQEMGSTAGRNLFHSFSEFNVAKGQTVTFTGNNNLRNVISRVTGSSESSVDGTLRSKVGRADVYLINPNGVTFGPDAKVDVPAAFHVSTADEIKFKDGARFSVRDPNASTLSAAEPAAFGYLGTSPSNNGLIKVDGAQLEVKPGQTMDMAAGQIRVEKNALLRTEAGEIRLTTSRGQGVVSLERDGDGHLPMPEDTPNEASSGVIAVDNATIDASGAGAGRVSISGGATSVRGSIIKADNLGDTDAGDHRGLDMHVHSLNADGTLMAADVYGAGTGGKVRVRTAGDARVVNGSQVRSAATLNEDGTDRGAPGQMEIEAGGDLTIDRQSAGSTTGIASRVSASSRAGGSPMSIRTGRDLNVQNGGVIVSSTSGSQNGSDIRVTTGRHLTVDGKGNQSVNTVIVSQTLSKDQAGGAGKLQLAAGGSVNVADGASVSSRTFGAGAAGNINVAAGGDVILDRRGNPLLTDIASKAGTGANGGKVGAVRINAANDVRVLNGSELVTSNFVGPGDVGDVTVSAGNDVTLDAGNSVEFNVIGSSARQGIAVPSSVLVEAGRDVNVLNGSSITLGTFLRGNSGRLVVKAGRDVLVDNVDHPFDTVIATNASPRAVGDAADIEVEAGRAVRVIRGGVIQSGTASQFKGGSISIRAGESVVVDGADSPHPTVIASTSNDGPGADAGDLRIVSGGQIRVANGGRIAAGTRTIGNAGDVDLRAAGNVIVERGGFVNASTDAGGQAGTVTVQAGGDIVVDGRDSSERTAIRSLATAEPESTGHAGNVVVRAQGGITLLGGGTIDSSTLARGNAGNVEVSAGDKLTIVGTGADAPETGVFSAAGTGSQGNAGRVAVSATSIAVSNRGAISVLKEGLAPNPTDIKSGQLSVKAENLTLIGGKILASTSGNVDGGSITVAAANTLRISGKGEISATTTSTGAAGSIEVSGRRIEIDDSEISAASRGPGSSGRSGGVTVSALESLRIVNSGAISIANEGMGADSTDAQPGQIMVNAHQVSLDGGKISATTSGLGSAGSIQIEATGHLDLAGASVVSSSTAGAGAAGSVNARAVRIDIDGSEVSAASTGANSSGKTGDVTLVAGDSLSITNGGVVSISNQATPPESPGIEPGKLVVRAGGDLAMDRGAMLASTTGSVAGGSIDVLAGRNIALTNGSELKATTSGAGAAGSITVAGRRIRVDGSTVAAASEGTGSSGRTGDIDLTASRSLIIADGGRVSIRNDSLVGPSSEPSPAFFHGRSVVSARQSRSLAATLANTGQIRMASPVVRLNRASVIADTTGNVDAGAIRVTARRSLGMRRGSVISSSTSGLGRAGKLSIKAGELTLRRSRIQALAGLESSGLTGGITIQARRWAKFENGSGISIANAASPERLDVDSGALRLMAPSLTLENSRITSSSTGNLAAGDIDLRFGPSLVLLSGLVTTEANTGNGGAIDLAGDGRIDLENSRITSSVAAGKGNGGDITVSAKDLLLSTGLIEAKAASGNGGRVSLNVRTLLASGNIINRRDVSLGDYLRNAAAAGAWQKEEFGNNVISAVSQSGLSGTIELASPQLNLSGALSNLGNPLFDTSEVRPDACRKEPGSTLTVEGRGGLPPRLRDWTLY